MAMKQYLSLIGKGWGQAESLAVREEGDRDEKTSGVFCPSFLPGHPSPAGAASGGTQPRSSSVRHVILRSIPALPHGSSWNLMVNSPESSWNCVGTIRAYDR
jgi:hypothetical protein